MNKTFQNNNYTISILGCGWLGLPLAESLNSNGITIKGSTSSESNLQDLKLRGINPFLIYLNPDLNQDFDTEFFNSDILIVNFPPKRRDDIIEWHTLQVKSLINEIRRSKISKVIFISSTSVYADINTEVTEINEEIPNKNSGKALRIAEKLFTQETKFSTSIIRFGGLIGYDRNPGRFLAGKKKLKNGDAPVNLIHRDDCIGIIEHVIANNIWGEIINACCPEHPKRKDFYEAAAIAGGFQLPNFIPNKENYKIINCDKLIHQINYSFKYLNPIEIINLKNT